MLSRRQVIGGAAAIAAFAGMVAFTAPAHAAVIATITQVGNNVVLEASGTLNISSLVAGGGSFVGATVIPNSPTAFFVGTTAFANYGGYGIPSSLPSFGTGGETNANTASGDTFGIVGTSLMLASGYVSGSQLSGTATFDNTTISALGITPGTYTTSWGSGASADSLTLQIAAVPEPSSIGLLAAGIGALSLGMAASRRRKGTCT